jgi:hypothetical protein
MEMSGSSKTSWPELKGVPAEVAKRNILAGRAGGGGARWVVVLRDHGF